MPTTSSFELRRASLENRRALTRSDRAENSARICRKFLSSPLFFRSNNIACYLPMVDEVDTRLIFDRAWRAKKQIFVPKIENNETMRFVKIQRNTRMEQNFFGLWEPDSGLTLPPKNFDVVVTPVVAFDENCNRIGMGGGYFDRCFAFLNHNRRYRHTKLAGLAFDCQKVEKITPNPWDIRLYRVFTETN
jgi:5-formyltetrahydrofolate cyclo-ligase